MARQSVHLFRSCHPAAIFLVSLLAFGTSLPADADLAPDRDMAYQEQVEAELAATDPEAATLFRRATEAMDAGDHAAAEAAFRQVLERVPGSSPAVRRLGSSLVGQGRRDEGLAQLERALELERSPENLFSLGFALSFQDEQAEPTPQDLARAVNLVDEAIARDASEPNYWFIRGHLALTMQDLPALRRVTHHLSAHHPDEMTTHYLAAIRAALDEQWTLAEREIREAESLGLPPEAVEEFLAMGVASRASAWRWARYVGIACLVWATGLGLLFVAGKILSSLTLRSLEADDPNQPVSEQVRRLRGLYRTVVTAAGLYWYISLPFVAILVVALTGAVFYAFLAIGTIPIKIAAILGIGALVTLYALVRSLFVRIRDDEDPGRALTEADAPGLWAMAREVAAEVGTRPVDEIWLTPGTELAVFERGTMRQRLGDDARRALLLGAGVLDGFDQNALRAVLAHEYGHFSHRDTAGGDVALRVQNGIMKFALALAEAGYAVAWNLAFQFLRLYDFLYRRISHGAIRLQEVLADRVAIQRYGLDAFQQGLTHVIRRSVEFDHLANAELGEAIQNQRAVANLYSLPLPSDTDTALALDAQVRAALEADTTEDDSHPSPKDRFRLGARIQAPGPRGPGGPVWGLFRDPEALKHEMHESILDTVEQSYDLVREGRWDR